MMGKLKPLIITGSAGIGKSMSGKGYIEDAAGSLLELEQITKMLERKRK
jgi:hypothetical protein